MSAEAAWPLTSDRPAPQLIWRAHPARERFAHAAAAAVAVLALAAGAWAFGGHLAWGGGALVVLVVSLHRFFFPSRFEIDEQGITARCLLGRQRLAWADVRRFVHDQRGGFLSRRAVPSRLDAFSGMHVLFGRDRDRVIAAIRARVTEGDSA